MSLLQAQYANLKQTLRLNLAFAKSIQEFRFWSLELASLGSLWDFSKSHSDLLNYEAHSNHTLQF